MVSVEDDGAGLDLPASWEEGRAPPLEAPPTSPALAAEEGRWKDARALAMRAVGEYPTTDAAPASLSLVGAAAGVQWWLGIPWSAWAFPFWGLLAAAPQFALGWLIVQVAARLWERLDPSQEILELGR